jgi:hypothetical protein
MQPEKLISLYNSIIFILQAKARDAPVAKDSLSNIKLGYPSFEKTNTLLWQANIMLPKN